MIKASRLFLALLVGSMIFTSCEEDLNDEESGDVRDRFVGTWSVTETENNQTRNYDVTISKSDFNSARINIFNFYKLGESDSAFASVSTVSSNTITIPNQTLNFHGISGTGVLQDDNTIDFNYTVDDGNGAVDVSASFSR
jgi:hypothetical protein